MKISRKISLMPVAVLVTAVGLLGAGCERNDRRIPAATSEKKMKNKTLTPAERRAREGSPKSSLQSANQSTKVAPVPAIVEAEEDAELDDLYSDDGIVVAPEDPEKPEMPDTGLTNEERMNLSKDDEEMVCSDSPHAHSQFLRPDIAYSVTGLDCFGDLPQSLGEVPKALGRSIASEPTRCEPHDHPMFLRQDMEWSVTREDCRGDNP